MIYRALDTKATTFIPMLKKVEKTMMDMKKPEPMVIIAGDFNFPFIEWIRNDMNICSYKMKSDSYGKTEEKKKQFYEMMEIMDKFSLVQAIQEPTRKENTLDLVFTNDISIFTKVEVTGTIMSDLNIIEITTTLDDDGKNINNKEFNVDTKENYL